VTDKSNDATRVPPGTWVVARTRLDAPYPCRCHERRYDQCSAVFCPCAGRTDPQNSTCCANRFGPADVVQAGIEYRIRKMQRGEG
jgi:hypothetical protein